MVNQHPISKGIKRLSTFGINSGFFLTGIGSSILGSTLPSLALNLNVEVDAMTIVVMAKGVGYVMGSLVTPFFARRMSQYLILMLSLLVIAIGQLGCPVMPSILSLAALEVITGIGMGTFEISGYVLIFNIWKNSLDSIMQSSQLFYAIGSSLAPFIALPFIYESLTEICEEDVQVVDNVTVNESNCDYNVSKHMLTDNIPYLAPSYFIVGGFAVSISMVFLYLSLTQDKILSPRKAQQQVLDNKVFRFLWLLLQAIFYFGHVGVEISVSSFLYTFLTIGDFQASKTVGTTINSIWWLSFMLGNLVVIFASRRLRPRQILTIDAIGILISMVVLLLSGFVNHTFIWLGIPMYGFFLASMYPSGMSWSERCILFNARATSVVVVSGSVGDIVIQSLIGTRIKDDPNSLLWVVSVVTMVTVITFFLLFLLETKKSKFPKILSDIESEDKSLSPNEKESGDEESLPDNRQDEDKSFAEQKEEDVLIQNKPTVVA